MYRSCLLAWTASLTFGCLAEPERGRSSDDFAITAKPTPPTELEGGLSPTETGEAPWLGPTLLASAGSAQVPSAVSWAPGRLDVFGAALQPGDVFELAHWWYDGAWHGPELQGGTLGGDPCAISRKSGQLDVFAVDGSGDREMISHWWFDGSWQGPVSLPGAAAHARVVAAPSVVSPGADGLRVFAAQSSRGDPDIVSFSYERNWGDPVGLPGRSDGSTSGPTAVSSEGGRIDLFAPDVSSGELVHWWFDGRWNGPELLGGRLIPDAPLSAVPSKGGRLDVFGASGLGGALAVGVELAHWWYDGRWHGPELLGGTLANDPTGPSAVSRGAGLLDVFATDALTGELAHWSYDGEWNGPELLGGNLASTPSAVSQAPGSLDVFAFDLDSHALAWWSLRPTATSPSPQPVGGKASLIL
jgi:hypothetical protein